MFARLHGGRMRNILLMGGLLGGVCGILGLIQPEAAGGGFGLIRSPRRAITASAC